MRTPTKYLVNIADKVSIQLSADMSANAVAALPACSGRIGKTSIKQLIEGSKDSVKGWQIITPQAEQVKRANKLGIHKVGEHKLRKRLPMMIYCTLTPRGELYKHRAQGDMQSFLNALKTASSGSASEYQEIATTLQWSREMVSVYAAAAANKGLVTKVRNSNYWHGNAQASV